MQTTFTVTLTDAELKAIAEKRRLEIQEKSKRVQARSGVVKSYHDAYYNQNALIRKGHLNYNKK